MRADKHGLKAADEEPRHQQDVAAMTQRLAKCLADALVDSIVRWWWLARDGRDQRDDQRHSNRQNDQRDDIALARYEILRNGHNQHLAGGPAGARDAQK